MGILKLIAMILLAVYLFFTGAFSIFGVAPSMAINCFIGLSAIGAGILLLITVKDWCQH